MKELLSSVNLAVFFVPVFFLANNRGFFIIVDISKVYVMSDLTSQSSPEFHSFFNKEKRSAKTATKIDFN